MSASAQRPGSAGEYATSRRGGLTNEEVRMVEALRNRERPMSWQHIAARFGRCEADIKAIFIPAEVANDLEHWPLGETSTTVKNAVRKVAEAHGITLADLANKRRGGHGETEVKLWAAQRDAYVAAQAAGRLTMMQMETVFLRDNSTICRAMSSLRSAR